MNAAAEQEARFRQAAPCRMLRRTLFWQHSSQAVTVDASAFHSPSDCAQAHAPFTHTTTFAKGWPVPGERPGHTGMLIR